MDSGRFREPTSPHAIVAERSGHLSTADGPYTLVDGRVASEVTGVTLVLDNGQDVVATVADGWLLAWWPSDVAATSSQVTNPSGTMFEILVSSTKGPPTLPRPRFLHADHDSRRNQRGSPLRQLRRWKGGVRELWQQRQRPERHPSREQREHWRDRNRPHEVLSPPTNPGERQPGAPGHGSASALFGVLPHSPPSCPHSPS